MNIYLEYKDGKSAKFWKIKLTGKTITVTYGKIGTDGQSKTKTFETSGEAKADAKKLIAQKSKSGYQEPKINTDNSDLKSSFNKPPFSRI